MSSMVRQYQAALRNDYTFLRTPAQVREFVRSDRLEALLDNEYLMVNRVSFPYARPEVRLFVERLAKQYHEATGERLVVTSLTRPLSSQPRNAHKLSVHPAGMAVDLRVPTNVMARVWLESALLGLEAQGVLDATRERKPPHYHVAVFPDQYAAHAERLIAQEKLAAANAPATDAVHGDVNTEASLEPSDASQSSHEGGERGEETAQQPGGPAAPIFAALGVTWLVAGAGLARHRRRRTDR